MCFEGYLGILAPFSFSLVLCGCELSSFTGCLLPAWSWLWPDVISQLSWALRCEPSPPQCTAFVLVMQNWLTRDSKTCFPDWCAGRGNSQKDTCCMLPFICASKILYRHINHACIKMAQIVEVKYLGGKIFMETQGTNRRGKG